MSHQPDVRQPLLGPSHQSRDPQATDSMHSKARRFHPNPLGYTLHPPLDTRGPEMAVRPPKDTQRVGSSPGDHLQPPPFSTCCRPHPQEQGPQPGLQMVPSTCYRGPRGCRGRE